MLKIAIASVLFYTMISPFQSGNKRMIIIFSSAGNSATLLQQIKLLHSDTAGLRERDIITQIHLIDERNRAFFKKYDALDKPFLFLLIGKDGGEKLRSTSIVSTQKLFGLIDQMPMRKQEMKKQ